MRPEAWTYETAPDLGEPLVERLKRFPREPDMLIYGVRWLVALLIRVYLKIWHRLEIRGAEHLPADDSFVLVANHASHLDTLALLAALPFSRLHNAFPAAAADTFFVSVPRIALAAIVVNALPFHRKARQRRSLDLCRALLGNPANVLILFPEGTRSATGEIGAFRPGVGLLLAGSGVRVVPCRIEGTHEAWPKCAWLPRPRKVRLTIGAPREYAGRPRSRESAERIAAELREAVLATSAPCTPASASSRP